MIRTLEVKGFKCLRYNRVDLDGFQIVVGPNASGKSTFFDVFRLIRDILNVGVEKAVLGDERTGVLQRASDPRDIAWFRGADDVEIVLTAVVPEPIRKSYDLEYSTCRYEIALSSDPEPGIHTEGFYLCRDLPQTSSSTLDLPFPHPHTPPPTIVQERKRRTPKAWKKVIAKVGETGNDYFASETGGWNNLFRLGPAKSALANLPEDERRFPVATWFKRFMMEGVQAIALDAGKIRLPSPRRSPGEYLPDGSNLPWVVHELERRHPAALKDWVTHLQTALPDLQSIHTVERPEDRHRYVVLKYESGLEIPSWVVSDGTLRLLALTLLAYAPNPPKLLMIEEPENGIHPRAVETVFQSLSSIYGSQVFCASHSPVFLTLAKANQLLCFARDRSGATDIVRGDRHPRLKEYKEVASLGSLFASGVLG